MQEKAKTINILGKYVYCAGGSIARNSGAVNKRLTIQGECVKKQRGKEQNEQKKSGADPDVASGVRLIGKFSAFLFFERDFLKKPANVAKGQIEKLGKRHLRHSPLSER